MQRHELRERVRVALAAGVDEPSFLGRSVDRARGGAHIDELGLGGQDATATFTGVNQLMTNSGLGVATGFGGFVTLNDY